MSSIAVIGGGPGGYVAAIRAAQLGAAVTLIEKENLGGTCLNVGCIPTKALLASAHLFEAAKKGEKQGVRAEVTLDFAQVQKNKASVVRRLVGGVGGLMQANKITVLTGTASFVDDRTLSVETAEGTQTLTPDKIIIAAGSVPAMPPIPGVDAPQCIDSTGALALEEVPARMVIVGGGVIGVELGSAYAAFGTRVTIVEMMPAILPMMDAELTGQLHKRLKSDGIDIHTGAKVELIEDGGAAARVHVQAGDKPMIFEAEKVLVCVGRRTATEALALDKAGVANDRGRITVDERMQTNIPHIYAIGDCLGRTMLAHVAEAQGEVAAENAMGHAARYDEKTNPSCIYTDPELACVGLTEQQAQEQGIAVRVGRFPMAANGKALIANGGVGTVKVIADEKYGEILGLHILGPGATDLIAQGALLIGLEATLDEVIGTIYAHPTVSEAVREAALAAEKRAIHMPN